MTYTADAIEQIRTEYSDILPASRFLIAGFRTCTYRTERVEEFAIRGFCRRLNILARFIQNVFDKIPPEQSDEPDEDDRLDAVINLHTFSFNVFSALDNLAWLWASRR